MADKRPKLVAPRTTRHTVVITKQMRGVKESENVENDDSVETHTKEEKQEARAGDKLPEPRPTQQKTTTPTPTPKTPKTPTITPKPITAAAVLQGKYPNGLANKKKKQQRRQQQRQ
eukprot:m.202091 g.202091  ORF g.202091 m.202091 type:complete len:116 (-) comp15748_c1_seq22:1907-2254(-)